MYLHSTFMVVIELRKYLEDLLRRRIPPYLIFVLPPNDLINRR